MKLTIRSRGPGLRGLSQSLDRTTALDRALRTSADEVRAEAMDTLERDGGSGSEALAESLEVQRARPLAYRVMAKAPLAWFREFGALARAQQPWLRPALDRARPRIVRRIGQAIRRIAARRRPGRSALAVRR